MLALLQATERARLSLLQTLAPQGYLLIPAVVLLPRGWELEGLVAAQPAALVLSGLLAAGIGAWALARPGLTLQLRIADALSMLLGDRERIDGGID